MATKKDIFEQAIAIARENKASDKLIEALTVLLEPKRGGAQFTLEEVAVTNAAGEVTHILDSVFNKWVPVFDAEGEPAFYEKPDTELGWSRFSRAAEKARKDAEKIYKATKEAVFKDLMTAEISAEEAKDLMAVAEGKRKKLEIPKGFEYSDKRPE